MNEQAIQTLIGGQVWWILGLALLFLVRKLIESLIEGFLVFIGNDYNNDDVVWIGFNGKPRPGRIIRVGLSKTVFFIYEVRTDPHTGEAEITGGNKLVIQNSALKDLRIEKPLKNIDISKYNVPHMHNPKERRNERNGE